MTTRRQRDEKLGRGPSGGEIFLIVLLLVLGGVFLGVSLHYVSTTSEANTLAHKGFETTADTARVTYGPDPRHVTCHVTRVDVTYQVAAQEVSSHLSLLSDGDFATCPAPDMEALYAPGMPLLADPSHPQTVANRYDVLGELRGRSSNIGWPAAIAGMLLLCLAGVVTRAVRTTRRLR